MYELAIESDAIAGQLLSQLLSSSTMVEELSNWPAIALEVRSELTYADVCCRMLPYADVC